MHTGTNRLNAILLVMCLSLALTGQASAADGDGEQAVVTIYNHSNVRLYYQLRYCWNGTWSEWSECSHRYPNHGWQYHTLEQVDHIQIRFDQIGGDDEYTEKIYDLEFKSYPSHWNVGRDHGRKYYFQFDAGGSLLNLYTLGACPTCGR